MLLRWIRARRRRRLTAEPFPTEWTRILERGLPWYADLTAAEQARLKADLRTLVAEKNWEGCGGLVLTDEMRVATAATAALLLLGLEHDFYPNVHSILIYPTGYRAPTRSVRPDGIVTEELSPRLGEAWLDGPVVLSWSDLQRGNQHGRDGRNLVLHEFAHKLDMLDGRVDGLPPAVSPSQHAAWQEVLTSAQRELMQRLAQGRPPLLTPYPPDDPAELFAVASECFIEQPDALCRHYPKLYGMLRDYYRQDPARRTADANRRILPLPRT